MRLIFWIPHLVLAAVWNMAAERGGRVDGVEHFEVVLLACRVERKRLVVWGSLAPRNARRGR